MRHMLRAVLLVLIAVQAAAQDAAIPVPSTIKLEGVPAIPASLADRFAPYGEFRFAELLSWHPTRREILIATSFGPRRHVHLVAGPGGDRRQLTFGAAITGTGGAWFEPVRGDYFVFRRDPSGGSERPQLFRFDLATRAITLLTDGKSRNGGNGVVSSRKSGLIAFDSNRRTGNDRDIWMVDPLKPEGTRIVAEITGNWIVQDWSPDDSELLVEERASTDERYIWRINVKTGAKTALTPRGKQPEFWESPRYAPDGSSVYALSNRGSEFQRLWRCELKTSACTAITGEKDPVEDTWSAPGGGPAYAVSPDGRTIAVVFDRGSTSALELIDTVTLKPRHRPKVPLGTIKNLQWHGSGKDVAFNLQSMQAFVDVHSASAATGAVERWTASESGGANLQVLPPPEIVSWKSFDGMMVSGVLYRPPARFTGPRPVIINIHGGPDDQRERPRFLGRNAAFINELGIAMVFPNVRGTPGFGKAFLAADNGKLREDAVKDIGALLDWIALQPGLDKNRVMVTGASYGGYMTYAVAAKYSDRIKCAFAGLAISNFVSYLEQTEPVRLPSRRSEYGDERDPVMREFLTQISPVTQASKIRVPLFIMHGAKDTRVPLAQAQEMARAVRANGVPVWLAVYEDEGHGIANSANNDFNLFTWVKFVQEHLLK
jgi:dipeptidyl aminopeptidase/acylaminoacyl peptidase